MRLFRSAVLLPLALLLGCVLYAGQTTGQISTGATPAVSDPQAVALINQALAAVAGGIGLSDVTLTGSAERIAGSEDETGTATLKAMSSGQSRIDLSLPSGDRSEIRNPFSTVPSGPPPAGATGATFSQQTQPKLGASSGPDGVSHPIAFPNQLTDGVWFFPAFTLRNLASPGQYILSYIGADTRNGQAVVHVRATRRFLTTDQRVLTAEQHWSQMDLFLDPTTALPAALDFNIHPDNKPFLDIPVEIRFSAYQVVNGVQIPFHVQKYANNGLILDLQFQTATPNSGLATSTFAIQ